MHYLYFNERTQDFKIIGSGVTITEAYDGIAIANSESIDRLIGLSEGLSVYLIGNEATAEWLIDALDDVGTVTIKQD